jgi:hypothetical protein
MKIQYRKVSEETVNTQRCEESPRVIHARRIRPRAAVKTVQRRRRQVQRGCRENRKSFQHASKHTPEQVQVQRNPPIRRGVLHGVLWKSTERR